MSTDTPTATGTEAPIAATEQGERVPWLRGVAWPLTRRIVIALWRHLLTLYVVARLGLVWVAFCAATGLADTTPAPTATAPRPPPGCVTSPAWTTSTPAPTARPCA